MGCFDGYSSSMMSVLWEKSERKFPPTIPFVAHLSMRLIATGSRTEAKHSNTAEKSFPERCLTASIFQQSTKRGLWQTQKKRKTRRKSLPNASASKLRKLNQIIPLPFAGHSHMSITHTPLHGWNMADTEKKLPQKLDPDAPGPCWTLHNREHTLCTLLCVFLFLLGCVFVVGHKSVCWQSWLKCE